MKMMFEGMFEKYKKNCRKCGEPTWQSVLVGENDWIVPKNCKCRQERLGDSDLFEYAKEQSELEKISKRSELIRRYTCGFSEEQLNWTFEKCVKRDEAFTRCSNYTKNAQECLERGLGLYLYGAIGRGKTYLAACIANVLYPFYTVKMTSIAKIVSDSYTIKLDKLDEWFDKQKNIDFLFIDDYGTEQMNSNSYQVIFRIIDSRLLAKKPIIITSNLQRDKKNESLEISRLNDRIFSVCTPIKVDGQNIRDELSAVSDLSARLIDQHDIPEF